jgi:hypothetical protein
MAIKAAKATKASRKLKAREDVLAYLQGRSWTDVPLAPFLTDLITTYKNRVEDVADTTLLDYLTADVVFRSLPTAHRGDCTWAQAVAALREYLEAHPGLKVGQAIVAIRGGGILRPSNREFIELARLLREREAANATPPTA